MASLWRSVFVRRVTVIVAVAALCAVPRVAALAFDGGGVGGGGGQSAAATQVAGSTSSTGGQGGARRDHKADEKSSDRDDLKTVLTFIKDTAWAFVLVGVLIAFGDPLGALLVTVGSRLGTSNVTFEVKNVTVKLEAPVDPPGHVDVSLLSSALELDLDSPLGSASEADPIGEIRDYLTVTLGNNERDEWARTAGAAAVEQMRLARSAFANVLEDAKSTSAEKGASLRAFAAALAACRFVEADWLTRADERRSLEALLEACPHDADHVLVYHSLGKAHADGGAWEAGERALEWLIVPTPARRLEAAATFISCRYNAFVQRSLDADTGTIPPDELEPFAEGLWNLCERLDAEMRTALSGNRIDNPSLEERRLNSNIGGVLSTMANAMPKGQRAHWLSKAEPFLKRCTETIGNAPPSPNDFNNYADLLRQLGRYREAFAALATTRAMCPDWDPCYADTEARTLYDAGRLLDSLLALEEYDETKALASAWPATNLAQVIDNQIFRAKLVYHCARKQRLSDVDSVIDILEGVDRAVYRNRKLLESARCGDQTEPPRNQFERLDRLLADALGDAYLQAWGRVDDAERLYDRAQGYLGVAPESRWNWQVKLAQGNLRQAQLDRQSLDSGQARQRRDRAAKWLASSASIYSDVPLKGTDIGDLRLRSRLKVFLALLEANQRLASESLRQEDVKAAKDLSDGVLSTLLTTMRTARSDARSARILQSAALLDRIDEAEARQLYVQGRVLAADPACQMTDALAQTLHSKLASALALSKNVRWRERVALTLGSLLMRAALEGEGDLVGWQERALHFFEMALGSTEPGNRAEALRAYADAVQNRRAVVNRARELQRRKT